MSNRDKCEICQKAEIMYIITEVIHISEERDRTRKLCANCLITNCSDAVYFRELFPFDK